MTSRGRCRPNMLCLLALAIVVINGLALIPSGVAASAPGRGASFYVVAFDHKITDEARAGLESAGVTIVDYEPKDSYIVWATSSQVQKTADLADVSAVTPLESARKLDSGVMSLSGRIAHAEVTVYGPALEGVMGFLSRFGKISDAYAARADGLLYTVALPLDASLLDEVVSHPAVMYVNQGAGRAMPEDERGTQIQAGNITGAVGEREPSPGYNDWLDKVKLDGKGIKVAIVDTGITTLHPDISDRVVETYDYSDFSEPIDSGGHGSHVTGIVGGHPDDAVVLKDPDGFAYGQGVAPAVKFVNQNAIGTTATFPPQGGFQVLSRDAWNAGARMWNASWHTGEGNRAGYLASVRTMDEISRNALFDKKGSEEFLLVFSAGNAGSNGPTVPKEAKNLIAVGSSMSGRGPHYPLTSNIDEISSFSSKGPTLDGRIFPTISAPGENVVSARAPDGALPCQGPVDAAPVYCTISGTSMAAPHVTGASALVHQWWKREHGGLPSPAMVKALLVNSATDIGPADIPNNNEGWGRVNLGELFAPAPSRYVDQASVFHGVRDQKIYDITVKKGVSRLKITTAWSDAPAAVGAEIALVNDLDVVVERVAGGKVTQTWLGNVFANGKSKMGGKADRLNNLENVFIDKPQPGRYRITIRAANLPGDGIPENSDKTDQDFALVARAISLHKAK